MEPQPTLKMTVSLNTLEHLGINLYSSIPAVLSELVANAWDADAQEVRLNIDRDAGTISVIDTGDGMTRDQVISRFLKVGYKKRNDIEGKTPKGRLPMGRKGIGKLSTFSIAKTVQVITNPGSQTTAFKMNLDDIQAVVNSGVSNEYEPEEITAPENTPIGTSIVLSDLSKSITSATDSHLRRRLSRRFSIIGDVNDFRVFINGQEITTADRGYHDSLEFAWVYNNDDSFDKLCSNLRQKPFYRGDHKPVKAGDMTLNITGWIGTVSRPSALKDDTGDSLNRIAIYIRGKLAQEDILSSFGRKEIFADYIVGEIHCEELDVDTHSDIATSSRQNLKEDDARYIAVRDFIGNELSYIAGQWSDLRRQEGTRHARTIPAISEWLDGLSGDTKIKAEKWVGRLGTLRSDDDRTARELMKASILAFESYRRTEELSVLDEIDDASLEQVLKVFKSVESLEMSYYGQIVSMRIGVITALEEKLDADERELAIRDHIYQNLWLLDPSWERAKGSDHAESRLKTFLEDDSAELSETERLGRIDIGYRTVAGKHVIIELKRGSVSVSVYDLAKQVGKYRSGALKIFSELGLGDLPLEIICVLGKYPREWNEPRGQETVIDSLASVDARVVLYDQLLNSAKNSYSDYLESHKTVDKLWDIFRSIDDFSREVDKKPL